MIILFSIFIAVLLQDYSSHLDLPGTNEVGAVLHVSSTEEVFIASNTRDAYSPIYRLNGTDFVYIDSVTSLDSGQNRFIWTGKDVYGYYFGGGNFDFTTAELSYVVKITSDVSGAQKTDHVLLHEVDNDIDYYLTSLTFDSDRNKGYCMLQKFDHTNSYLKIIDLEFMTGLSFITYTFENEYYWYLSVMVKNSLVAIGVKGDGQKARVMEIDVVTENEITTTNEINELVNVRAVQYDNDEEFLYFATTDGALIKMDLTYTVIDTLDISSDPIWTFQIDQNFIYVVLYSNPTSVVKIRKIDFQISRTVAISNSKFVKSSAIDLTDAVRPVLFVGGSDGVSTKIDLETCYPGYSYPLPCQECIAGTYSEIVDAQSCEKCPKGSYSESVGADTNLTCLSCEAGTYNDLEGADSPSFCELCREGYFCNERSVTDKGELFFGDEAQKCSCGYYCEDGSVNSRGWKKNDDNDKICGPGYYCPEGSYTAQGSGTCLAGYYCPAGSCNNTANECPAGYKCNNGNKTECPPGTWNDIGVHSTCQLCTQGTYNTIPGLENECTSECTAGYYCESGSRDQYGTLYNQDLEDKKFCEEGHYCISGSYNAQGFSISEPEEHLCSCGYYCKDGSFLETGQNVADNPTNPLDCPEGRYCEEGSVSVLGTGMCDLGYYCPKNSCNQTSMLCPAGHYCINGFKDTCNAGFWNEKGIHTSCELCQPGAYNSALGREEECDDKCSSGYYCETGAIDQFGTLYTDTGVTPKLCDAGYYCEMGSVDSKGRNIDDPFVEKICECGYYCEEGSIDAYGRNIVDNPTSVLQCREGHYCASGSTNDTGNGICDDGYYCPIGSCNRTSELCPAGNECESGLKTLCGAGLWNDKGIHIDCQKCKGGTYNTGTGRPIECVDLCEKGYYCLEGSVDKQGTLTGDSGVSPKLCESGHYCLEGSYDYFGNTEIEPVDHLCACGHYCEDGSFDSFGRNVVDNPTDPFLCSEGYFCVEGSTKPMDLNKKCTQGYYCPDGSCNSTDSLCPAGMKCLNGSATECERGTYSTKGVNTECDLCSEGYYNNEFGKSECTKNCESGYYCPSGSRDQFGTLHNELNVPTSPKLCKIGYYCPENSINEKGWTESNQFDHFCECGFFCISGSKDKYGRNINNPVDTNECEESYYCPDGSTDSHGLPTGGNCQNGYYCPPGSCNNTAEICPAGYKCIGGSKIACDPGSYNYAGIHFECEPCSEGTFSGVTGREQNCTTKCECGYYCPESSTISQMYDCWESFYCPEGTTNPTLQCDDGYYCPENSCGRQESECPAGHFCINGVKSECPLGSFSEIGVNLDCIDCGQGYFTDAVGAQNVSMCKPCPPGHYSNAFRAGEVECIPCPRGMFGDMTGNFDICQSCPSGTFSGVVAATSVTYCQNCPAGSYSGLVGAVENSSCILCPNGTFSSQPGTSECTPCSSNAYCPEGSIFEIPPPGTFQSSSYLDPTWVFENKLGSLWYLRVLIVMFLIILALFFVAVALPMCLCYYKDVFVVLSNFDLWYSTQHHYRDKELIRRKKTLMGGVCTITSFVVICIALFITGTIFISDNIKTENEFRFLGVESTETYRSNTNGNYEARIFINGNYFEDDCNNVNIYLSGFTEPISESNQEEEDEIIRNITVTNYDETNTLPSDPRGCEVVYICADCTLNFMQNVFMITFPRDMFSTKINYMISVPYFNPEQSFEVSGDILSDNEFIFSGINSPSRVDIKLYKTIRNEKTVFSSLLDIIKNNLGSIQKTGLTAETEKIVPGEQHPLKNFNVNSGISVTLNLYVSSKLLLMNDYVKMNFITFIAQEAAIVWLVYMLCGVLMRMIENIIKRLFPNSTKTDVDKMTPKTPKSQNLLTNDEMEKEMENDEIISNNEVVDESEKEKEKELDEEQEFSDLNSIQSPNTRRKRSKKKRRQPRKIRKRSKRRDSALKLTVEPNEEVYREGQYAVELKENDDLQNLPSSVYKERKRRLKQ